MSGLLIHCRLNQLGGHNLCQQDHQRLASTRPEEPIFSLEIEFTGRTWQDKVEEIRGVLKEKGCEALILRCSDFLFWSFMNLDFFQCS